MKIIIYTPTYQKSPGLRYRADMMKMALEKYFEVKLLCDSRESFLRRGYQLLGPALLTHRWWWERVGKRIAKVILSEKPDATILLTDVTAGAIPFLKKRRILTVLSVEDLSAEWLRMTSKEGFFSILQSYSILSDAVIAVSDRLRIKLRTIGIDAKVVQPGLEKTFVSLEEAVGRKERPHIVLHAGQIQFEEEKKAFEASVAQIVNEYSVMSYACGRFSNLMRARFPEVMWYNFPSPIDAIRNLKACSIGLIIRFRAHNPTRLYFHASMLQPVVAIGDNWVDEVTDNSIGVVAEPEKISEAMGKIIDNYREYARAVEAYAAENALQKAYEPLIEVLMNASTMTSRINT